MSTASNAELSSLFHSINDSANVLSGSFFTKPDASTTTSTGVAVNSLNNMKSFSTTSSSHLKNRELTTSTNNNNTANSTLDSAITELDGLVTGVVNDADALINSSPKITKQAPQSVGGHIYAAIDLAIGNAINHLRTFLNKPKSETYYGKIIAKSEALDKRLDVLFETTLLGRGQAKIDRLGKYIESKFSGLTQYNEWLRSDGHGEWYMQLATHFAKLPLRAAQNIINLLYGIIEGILFTTVHPIKSLNRIARMIITFLHQLAQPETWTKLGIGMMAMEIGQLAILTNPIAHISIGIATALLIAGISIGALKAAIKNQGHETQAAKENLFKQFKEIPECFLTSLLTGLIAGGVQRAITPRITTIEKARKLADKYVRKHNLPKYKDVQLKPNGKVIINWGKNPEAVRWFRDRYPKLFKKEDLNYWWDSSNGIEIQLPNSTIAYPILGGGRVIGKYYGWSDAYSYWRFHCPLSKAPGIKL